MLSYQHAFHAGNAADVHKHIALVSLLRRLQRKEAPFCYVDSHAGRGVYDLEGEEARKTGEAGSGIQRLVAQLDCAGFGEPPVPVRDYVDLVMQINQADSLRFYPGSAAFARALLREQDRAILLELHPQELRQLRRSMRGDRRVAIHARDCYEGLPGLLPPPIRRGLVLIDPSYEVREEYENVIRLLGKSIARWPQGVFAVWYPLLPDRRQQSFLRRLDKLGTPDTLISEFRFRESPVGLIGSGLAIVNAPWQFDDNLASAMRFVARALGAERAGCYEQRGIGQSSVFGGEDA